jgi:hypothetical protein
MWLQIGMDSMLKLLWEFIIQTGFAVLEIRPQNAFTAFRALLPSKDITGNYFLMNMEGLPQSQLFFYIFPESIE